MTEDLGAFWQHGFSNSSIAWDFDLFPKQDSKKDISFSPFGWTDSRRVGIVR